MKIVEGRYYRTRDGQKVGPMKYWQTYDLWVNGQGGAWQEDGSPRYPGAADSPRLVAEWQPPVGLTAITTPFGLLDRETQEALKAHPGPFEWWHGVGWFESERRPAWDVHFVYRVKPAPPKLRKIYLCEVHDTRTVFDTAMAATREALLYQHGEATVTEFVEVTK